MFLAEEKALAAFSGWHWVSSRFLLLVFFLASRSSFYKCSAALKPCERSLSLAFPCCSETGKTLLNLAQKSKSKPGLPIALLCWTCVLNPGHESQQNWLLRGSPRLSDQKSLAPAPSRALTVLSQENHRTPPPIVGVLLGGWTHVLLGG